MSSPQNGNGTQAATSNTPNSLSNYIDSLLGGTKWGGDVGSGATLTYSFPGASSSSANWASNPQYSDANEPSSASALSAMEQAATRNALAAWANVANLNFSEITETSSNVGDLRFTSTNQTKSNTAAWAYYPNNYWASGGDVWLSAPVMSGKAASSWQAGGNNYGTLIHELGHALGLKHPFSGETVLPTNQDSEQYSVMSYTNYSDNFFRTVTANSNGTYSQSSFSYTTVEPSTPMLYDIAAMQYMYGANMSYRTGDDVYTFDPNTPFYQTIWDAGGNDTISISNFSRGSTIDLRAGNYSTISFLSDPMPQGWTTTAVVTYTGNNDLAIAYGAVIENAIGGSGNDTLQGNGVNNTLNGGLGTDTAVFDGNKSNYKVSKNGNNYTVNSVAEGTDTLTNIEFLQFKDGTYPIDSVLQVANNLPTGSVIISGDAQQGKILTASNSLADLDGLGAISYQWLSNGSVISGATQSTYTLEATDVGKAISVKANYTDLLGTAESVTSSGTALVTALVTASQPGVRMFVESLGTFTAGGASTADDLYVIDGYGTGSSTRITINDSGTNRVQLVGGLTIKSSIIASNTTVLTLSNDAEITISNAAQFTYIIGGIPGTGTGGSNQTYTQFATTTLGAANTSSVVNGSSNILINSDGTTSGGSSPIVLPVGQTTLGTVTTVSATAAADVFTFNVAAARASISNTQDVITGFGVANDVLTLDLPTAMGATTLASFLGAGTQGTLATVVEIGSSAGTLINFGSDANGDVVNILLAGILTPADVVVNII